MTIHHNASYARTVTGSLLFTLYTLNAEGKTPSMIEIIRAESPTENMSLNTIEGRRSLLRTAIARGYIVAPPIGKGKGHRLFISRAGVSHLSYLRYEVYWSQVSAFSLPVA